MARENIMNEVLSDQYLLRKNQVSIYGVIDTSMAARIIPQLQYIDQKMTDDNVPEEERILTIHIDSPGGSVTDGLAIYDTINSLNCEVRTICVGMAASMAAVILSSGSKGMRYALPNSEVLIHQPLGGAQGQTTDVVIVAKHMQRVKARLNNILSMNTGKTVAKIARDTERDNVMSSEEAKAYGLVDDILYPAYIKAVGRKQS